MTFALLALALPAQAKEITLARVLNQVTAGETLTVGSDWIEPAKGEFSVGIALTNLATDRALVVSKGELRCTRGGVAGQVEGSGKPVAIGPGQTETITLVCTVPGATGEYGVDLLRVYDDPERTGAPTDQVLFEHVQWTLPEALADKKAQKVPPGFVPKVTDHPVPPPPGELAAPPEQQSLLDKMKDKLSSDGKEPKPFELGTKEYALSRPKNQVVAGDGALTVGADAVQPQDDHYVVKLALVNDTDEGLAIPQTEIRCRRGETQATLDYAAFGIGKKAITLGPGEVKLLTMKCQTGKLATGDFGITIGRVFADPAGTGAVDGEVRMKDVSWSIAELDLDPAVQAAE
ncbi:MAG: hypothetical protein R3F59_31705 [Myxococcota bacterium]